MKRLLLVDEEMALLHELRHLLQRHFAPRQLGVEVCIDPMQALQRLKEARFDVLVSGHRLPQLDGVTLLARARELDPRVVRLLGATADLDTVLAAVNRAGVFRYITRPWTDTQVLTDLRAALVYDPCAALSTHELERRRLEAMEPGITQVDWGPNGEVLMPGHLPTLPGML